MEGAASIADDVLARYAADAAREVEGVAGLVEGRLPRQGAVRISVDDGVTVELHLELTRGAAAQEVGAEVQRGVADYLERMAGARPRAVNVVIDEIA
jgi:uncharacterized alkaline shock family protein YloU